MKESKTQRHNLPQDPFELKKLSKLHPYRLGWTGMSRLSNWYGSLRMKPFLGSKFPAKPAKYLLPDRGFALEDTAVTSNQAELLHLAISETEYLEKPIVEIGSYRGTTTQQLALATPNLMYAVDPYIGYGGSQTDLAIFQERIRSLSNVRHLKMTSGQAFQQLKDIGFSFVFIDAVHDFANTWFDFCSWSSCVVPGGAIALHDVDDFPGTHLAFQKILAQSDRFFLWGYCPNLAIFQKR